LLSRDIGGENLLLILFFKTAYKDLMIFKSDTIVRY
jgi:hypothetical protein